MGSFTARPGKEAEAVEAFRSLLEPTRGENGCILYALHQGVDDPRRLAVVERWEPREPLDAHLASAHLQELLARAEELFGESGDIVCVQAPGLAWPLRPKAAAGRRPARGSRATLPMTTIRWRGSGRVSPTGGVMRTYETRPRRMSDAAEAGVVARLSAGGWTHYHREGCIDAPHRGEPGVRDLIHGPWLYLSRHWAPCPRCRPPAAGAGAEAERTAA